MSSQTVTEKTNKWMTTLLTGILATVLASTFGIGVWVGNIQAKQDAHFMLPGHTNAVDRIQANERSMESLITSLKFMQAAMTRIEGQVNDLHQRVYRRSELPPTNGVR